MGKERRDRSVSYDRYRSSPSHIDSNCTRRSRKSSSETKESVKEWEDARCPVCMEHPHNAVLLICSSHEKGCRPFMCDTSYRHSNCLDQFRKSFQGKDSSISQQLDEINPSDSDMLNLAPEPLSTDLQRVLGEEGPSTTSTSTTTITPMTTLAELSEDLDKPRQKLVCPLCRGEVTDWIVVDDARHFMNAKLRSCACETCNFSGTYTDLRKHARHEHPTARPSEADPDRQRDWTRLERQRDLGDLLSTLQSSFGGEERVDDSGIMSFDDGGWLTVFFLIRVFRPPGSNSPRRSNSWSGTSRARSQLGVRRRSTRLWGESYDGEAASSSRDENHNNNNNQSSDDGSGSRRRRVRRRTFNVDDDES